MRGRWLGGRDNQIPSNEDADDALQYTLVLKYEDSGQKKVCQLYRRVENETSFEFKQL